MIEEAATDLIALAQARGIAEPWMLPSFITEVADLQTQRLVRASHQPDEIQFHDRSIFCTAALAVHLGHPIPDALSLEMDRLRTQAGLYQKRVFFIKNLEFVTPTEARRISFGNHCDLNASTRGSIATPASRFLRLNLEACQTGSLPSRQRFENVS